jgi:zinc protease
VDLGLLTFNLVLASGVDLAKARDALLAEINNVCDAPLSSAELSTAKNKLLAERLAARETCEGKAEALAEAATLRGDPALVNTDFAKIDAVTAEQVQAVAQQWFTEKNRLELEYLPAKTKTKK